MALGKWRSRSVSEIIKVSKPKTKEQILEEKVAELEAVIDTMLGGDNDE